MQLQAVKKQLFFLSTGFFYVLLSVALMILTAGVEDSLNLIPFLKANSHKVAAFVEEIMRCLALIISSTFAIVFTIIFASVEMISYVNGAYRAHGSLPMDYLIFRMLCINVHLLCLLAQLYGFKLYRKYNNGTYWAIGFLSAVFIHLIWNQGVGLLVLQLVKVLHQSAVMALGS